jgi:hypothetical protein
MPPTDYVTRAESAGASAPAVSSMGDSAAGRVRRGLQNPGASRALYHSSLAARFHVSDAFQLFSRISCGDMLDT